MKLFILLFLLPTQAYCQDAFWQVIFGTPHEETKPSEVIADPVYEQPLYESEEPEFYSWELGTPDNLPDIEIIYDDSSPCGL